MFKSKDKYLSIILISPSILAVLIFVYGFIGWSVRVSLSQWKGLNPDYTWAGLKNYIALFSDPRFHVDVRNTLIFTGVFVVGSIILGFPGCHVRPRLKGGRLLPQFISFSNGYFIHCHWRSLALADEPRQRLPHQWLELIILIFAS